MKKLLLLLSFSYALLMCSASIVNASEEGCNVNPYSNIPSEDLEVWMESEDVASIVCSAFGEGYEYIVEFAVFPEANEWTEVTLDAPSQLCDDSGNFSFSDALESIANRFCDQQIVLIITPYCTNEAEESIGGEYGEDGDSATENTENSNSENGDIGGDGGENGIPVILSITTKCGEEREDYAHMAKIEFLDFGSHNEGMGTITGTPCSPTDIPCIKEHIHTVVNPGEVLPDAPIEALTSKRADETTELFDLKSFPNPVQDYLHFELPPNQVLEANIELSLVDSWGRIIEQVTFTDDLPDRWTINLSHLPSGIYFYQYVVNEHRKTGKIVKN